MIRADELDATFQEMGKERPYAVIVQPSLPSQRVADLALKYKFPTASAVRWFAEEGGLMSYTAAEVDMYRQAATYADRILKGAKPAGLPVQQPTNFELIINLKAAKALGLVIPESFLLEPMNSLNELD
jgi:putative ABC transport system substrate-binding protein